MPALFRNLRVLLPAAGLLVAAGGYTWWWHAVADAVRSRVPLMIAAGAEAGIALDPGTSEVGGFPYRVELALRGATAAGHGWHWAPERVRIFVQPWNLRHQVVLAGSAHRWGPAPDGTALAADVLRASLVHDRDGALQRISIEATGLSATRWSLHRMELHARRTPDGFEIASRLEDGRFTDRSVPTRPDFQYALLEGSVAPAPDLPALADPARWAHAGGVLEVSRLAFAWGPLQGDAQGTATLDGAGRPLGAFTLRTENFPGAIRFLEDQGWTSPAAARAAEAALVEAGHETAEATFPVTVQDGKVTVAGIPLLRVPPLVPVSAASPVRRRSHPDGFRESG